MSRHKTISLFRTAAVALLIICLVLSVGCKAPETSAPPAPPVTPEPVKEAPKPEPEPVKEAPKPETR